MKSLPELQAEIERRALQIINWRDVLAPPANKLEIYCAVRRAVDEVFWAEACARVEAELETN